MKLWLNVREGAEYAGVCRDTVYAACERREIRHARVGGRKAIRLKPEWIDAWLERHALDTQVQGTVGRTSSSENLRPELERRQLPGVIRVRRRVLLRADDLLNWLDQKRAPSPEE